MRIFLFLLLNLLTLSYFVEAKKCTGSPNCKACTNCSRCKYCSQQGGSCGACAGTSSEQHSRVRHSESSQDYSSPNGLYSKQVTYDENGNEVKSSTRNRKKHRKKNVIDLPDTMSESKIESKSNSSNIITDESNECSCSGWKFISFVLLGILIVQWYRSRTV